MAIKVICNDCGKQYVVKSELAGKRVKCKVCGHQFKIPLPVALKAVNSPVRVARSFIPKSVPESDEYGFANHPSGEEQAYAPPVKAVATAVADSSARETLGAVVRYLHYFQPNGWVLLGCLACAVLMGFYGNRAPNVFWWMLIDFPILAGLFLIVGVAAATISAILSPEEFKAPWSALFSVALRIAIGGILGHALFFRRFPKVEDQDFGLFFDRVVRLTIRVIGIAAMSVVLMLVSMASGSEPKNSPTDIQLRANKVLQDRAHPNHQAPNLQPFEVPKSMIDRLRQ